jgi:hypothetical protein
MGLYAWPINNNVKPTCQALFFSLHSKGGRHIIYLFLFLFFKLGHKSLTDFDSITSKRLKTQAPSTSPRKSIFHLKLYWKKIYSLFCIYLKKYIQKSKKICLFNNFSYFNHFVILLFRYLIFVCQNILKIIKKIQDAKNNTKNS